MDTYDAGYIAWPKGQPPVKSIKEQMIDKSMAAVADLLGPFNVFSREFVATYLVGDVNE